MPPSITQPGEHLLCKQAEIQSKSLFWLRFRISDEAKYVPKMFPALGVQQARRKANGLKAIGCGGPSFGSSVARTCSISVKIHGFGNPQCQKTTTRLGFDTGNRSRLTNSVIRSTLPSRTLSRPLATGSRC